MKDEHHKKIYIDLDSLFDTRLGCLGEVDPKLVQIALEQGFLTRSSDTFSFIKTETFNELYKLRNNETLKLSPLTNCHKLVCETVVRLLQGSIDSPEITSIGLVINTYPYVLTDQEAGDLLDLMVNKTAKLINIELKYLDDKQMNFKHCEENYDVLFIYDYLNFIERNVAANNHKKNSLYDRILFAPEIFLRDVSVKDLEKIYKKNPKVKGLTPAYAVQALASPILHIEFVDPKVFSVDLDLYKTKDKKE